MTPAIAGLVSRKYDIAQENADAANRISWAQSGLLGAQTTAYPAEAAARALAARGTGAAGFGQANLSNANALEVPRLAQSEEGLRQAQGTDLLGRLNLAQHLQGWQLAPDDNITNAGNYRFFGDAGGGGAARPSSPTVISGGITGTQNERSVLDTGSDAVDPNVIGGAQKKPGYDTGTSRVPGNGPSTVDSVDAKLAPDEAVLNAAAADHLGRSTIDFLNAIGAQKMGLDLGGDSSSKGGGKQKSADPASARSSPASAKSDRKQKSQGSGEAPDKSSPTKAEAGDNPKISQQTGSLPGYKKGTSNVGGGKKVSKNALPSPQVMQALLAMSGGGGGMPQMGPGGAQPLPQQLPQVA